MLNELSIDELANVIGGVDFEILAAPNIIANADGSAGRVEQSPVEMAIEAVMAGASLPARPNSPTLQGLTISASPSIDVSGPPAGNGGNLGWWSNPTYPKP